jgi:two-component system sensor histidine kinase GlrK
MMKLKNLLSLKSLIILGFLIAVIPLFLAVMYAALGLREASALSQTINYQVFEQTKTVSLVLQKTADIERKARLFVLLSDPAIRQPYEQQSYENTRVSLKQALSELLKLHIDNKISLLVNELSEKEDLIYQEIINSVTESTIKLPVDEAFQGLRESSASLSREYESHIDHQFNELRQQSASLEQELLTKGTILLVISFILIGILLAILSRSIRQLDTGIRRLGSGQLNDPIKVTGPSDLHYLGNCLDWLRIHLLDLKDSNQKFMQNVAREISLPLATIKENTELLLNETALDQETYPAHQSIAKQLRNNVDQLKTVSEELVRFSQITRNPELYTKEPINMKALLEAVIIKFQPRLNEKSINLISMARPVEIFGIPDQLQTIIEQLLSNAIKYSHQGGEIRIMIRDTDTLMELAVEDEGPGIDPDDLPHVFEPFFRSKTALTDEYGEGSGLGLAIVNEYVANHQGKVDIIDTRRDHLGVRILVQIPLTEKV